MTLKVVTVVGARPQFIKAAAVSRVASERSADVREVLVHTGQHSDENMSGVFFQELGIPEPHHHLGISGGRHGAMTGRMLAALEEVLLAERPDWALVYGDTNSTLAGALAAAKLHIPVAHVEAGLRSFNMAMPEEINRALTDRVSTLLLCPTEVAVRNLAQEGMTSGVHNVGDVMFDVARLVGELARRRSAIAERVGVENGSFVLATCHRAENTDDPVRLRNIVEALAALAETTAVVLPLHPRTRKVLGEKGLRGLGKARVIEPLGFLDMAALEQQACVIVTDSGGVQKEAFFYGVPCVTMRDETEWLETVSAGRNAVVGASAERIVAAARGAIGDRIAPPLTSPYGNGHAAEAIVSCLLSC